MSEKKYTPGPWEFVVYGLKAEMIEQQRAAGIEPTRVLTNEGQAVVMAREGDDRERVALVDCQSDYKRGKGHVAECAERDANAHLIAAAPDLLEVLEMALKQSNCPGENCAIDWHGLAQAVIAKAKGE